MHLIGRPAEVRSCPAVKIAHSRSGGTEYRAILVSCKEVALLSKAAFYLFFVCVRNFLLVVF